MKPRSRPDVSRMARLSRANAAGPGILIVVLAFLVTACSAASGDVSGPEPVTSTAPPVAIVPTPAPSSSEPVQLLVLGDSIAIPEMGCGGCEGFDRQYATYLEDITGRPVELVNEARPEARIGDLQRLLETDATVQAAVGRADVVVVSIGYNDTPPWPSDLPCDTPPVQKDSDLFPALLAMTPECIDATIALYQADLNAAYGRIQELANGRPQVRIALGVFNNLEDNPGGDGTIRDVAPDVYNAAAEVFASVIDQWNEADCVAAQAHGFVCGDLQHAFNGPTGSGSIKGLVNPADFVHPNAAGQAVIASLLKGVDVSSLGTD